MNKSKKILMIVIGIIAVIAVVIALMVSCGNNKGEVETTTGETTVAEVTTEDVTISDEIEEPGDLEIPETDKNGEIITEKETKKKANKKNNKKDKETTNYWDNVQVIEDANETETVTDENGETIPEEYPGQNSGWSPIVKPEDLE